MKHNIGNLLISDFPKDFTTRHICFTNTMRKKVNAIMMNQFASLAKHKKTNVLELKALEYSENSQDVKLTAGTPFIARVNREKMNLFNNQMWIIKQISLKKETITIQEEDGEMTMDIANDTVQKLFNPGWCITCHRSQGSTYDHPYTVHEFDRMDDRLKYVALSRATAVEHIRVWW